MTVHKVTPELRARYAIEGAQSFVHRALEAAQTIAHAAQQGETKVVEQYLKNLESLQVEAERWWSEGS